MLNQRGESIFKIHLKFKSVTYNEKLMIFKQIDASSFDSFEMQYEFSDLSAITEPTILCNQYL